MLHINEFLVNKRIDKKIDQNVYTYFPNSKIELIENIKELLYKEEHNLNRIDTSKIKDMSSLFCMVDIINAGIANIDFDISDWNVSKVTNMRHMFDKCKQFNCNLYNWDVSKVKNMEAMFIGCSKFEGKGLENWNVGKVNNMNFMFSGCRSFDQNIVKWNVSNVKNMSGMFCDCENFNQPLNNWDVSNVEDISYMFSGCKKFDQDLNDWDVSKVRNMKYMFNICKMSKNTPKWYKQ
ncbi:MAG: BspA family leucine-rich repeat surface protein [Clostridia bacterium]|nr:BspA family leucine-rich repeat surface protein [Clostridia bacterium]